MTTLLRTDERTVASATEALRWSIIRSVIAFVLSCSVTPAVFATYFVKTATFSHIEFYGHMRIDSPNIVWVQVPGTWGSTTCAADWVCFNGKENPAYVAALLAARAMNMAVSFSVDDSYSKLSGYCQVTDVAF
jgi:hypothetical protein